MRTGKARTGLSARLACHRRWTAYGMSVPSHTRGGSRMRESRPYGSVRGARDETRVPTATFATGIWTDPGSSRAGCSASSLNGLRLRAISVIWRRYDGREAVLYLLEGQL